MADTKLIREFSAAVINGDTECVRDLFSHHGEILKSRGLLNERLRDAALEDNVAMIELLVELGADINAPEADDKPEGVINEAAAEGATRVVDWLLRHGARVNHEIGGVRRCFPLTGAVVSGHLSIVKMLVDQGNADINATWGGQNALSFAIMYGRKDIESYLRSRGAIEPRQQGTVPPKNRPHNAILEHIEKHLGIPSPLTLHDVVPSDPSIGIVIVQMEEKTALVTLGMSDHPMKTSPGQEAYRFAELVMYLPKSWPLSEKDLKEPNNNWPIIWLRKIALYPHLNNTSLGGPATIIANGEPPMPLASNTQMTCLLAITEKSKLGWLHLENGVQVAFYTLYPLYTEERDLEKREGIAMLLKLFQERKISRIVDLHRPSVAKLDQR
jgi:hypothetical protein